MAAIDIPADYWTVRPRGFTALIAPYSAALEAHAGDVGEAAGGLLGGVDTDARQQLGDLDGDADVILAAVATERQALGTTPTGDVLAAYPTADQGTGYADADVNAAGGVVVPEPVFLPPPPFPADGNAPPLPPEGQPGPPPPVPAPPDVGGASTTAAAALAPPAPSAPQLAAGGDGAALSPDASTIPPAPSTPGTAGEQPGDNAAPPPPRYVTHEELAALLDTFSPTITLVV